MTAPKPYLLKLLLLFAVLFLCGYSYGQTDISGRVIDGKDKSPISYANVVLKGTLTGVTTDADGYFNFRTYERSDSLIVTYVGYPRRAIAIKRGQKQSLTIEMGSEAYQITEVEVKPGKHKQRYHVDTAALYVFHQIVEHKKYNKEEYLKDYKLEEYQKIQIGLQNPKAWFLRLRILKPFAFALANRDTTADSTVIIPALLKEDISDVYYRKDPKAIRRYIKADQFTGVNNFSVGRLVNYAFDRVNIYDEVFVLLNKSYISPFAHGAYGTTYDYFLTDTQRVAGRTEYKLRFVDRSPVDLALKGYAWIDSATWAVRYITFRPNERSNVNYLKDYSITQNYALVDKTWILKSEDLLSVATIFKKMKTPMAVVVKKHMERRNIQLDVPIEDSVFKGIEKDITMPGAHDRTKEYWDTMRFNPLSPSEVRLVKIHDTIKTVPAYKRFYWFGKFVSTANIQIGPIDISRIYKIVSRNTIEGTRLRLGIGTNEFFSKKYHIFGYGAYGTKDHVFRYNVTVHFPLPEKNDLWRQFEFYYQYDLNQLGQQSQLITFDNILSYTSPLPKQQYLMNIREWKLSLENEWIRGFTSIMSAHVQTFYDIPGVFDFKVKNSDGKIVHMPSFSTFDLGVDNRYAYKDQYYRLGFYRFFIETKSPIFLFNYHVGMIELNGQRNVYNKFQLTMIHRLSWLMGHTYYSLQVGKILGLSPYPTSYVVAGGQSIFFNNLDYNMTNQYEFVTDQYFSWYLEHHFEGFFFNKIPLFNRLQIREIIYVRGLWGSYSQANFNAIIPGFDFKAPSAYPYIEAGFGFENIFKLIRIDFLWRATYRNGSAKDFLPKGGLSVSF